jgi:hypothetical protein
MATDEHRFTRYSVARQAAIIGLGTDADRVGAAQAAIRNADANRY